MQAVLEDKALKPFTKALACLSKYGEDTVIRASSDALSLSSLNSSHSAYGNFKYHRDFFQKYALMHSADARPSTSRTTNDNFLVWSINTKALLTILRHRNNDKNAERCEFTIIEGITPETQEEVREDEDSLESRLIIRLHCKYGVVKTHRLLLNSVAENFVPVKPQADLDNRISVRPRTLKEIIDHFPFSKGVKSDPQLIWRFGDLDVCVRSVDGGVDAKGKTQLATELTISSEDFEEYDVPITPMTVGFHLREFNATVAFAEGISVLMEMRLAAPSEPLCISAEADDCQVQFMISTMQVRGADNDEPRPSVQQAAANRSVTPSNGRKREREEDAGSRRKQEKRKSMKVVEKSDAPSANADALRISQRSATTDAHPEPSASQAPLFLASQLSQATVENLRESGLGIEDMDADEFAAMMDDEGEEVDYSNALLPSQSNYGDFQIGASEEPDLREETFDYVDHEEEDGVGFEPTQASRTMNGDKAFQPLFDD